eukprot:TRINITY_DN10149_c0_g1_i1.p1 TRINITY_DN10149_c0_g1~~TRINITY_DN10149_c0_g1_i1.p1  ORF type:complete len:172 (+),score=34.30 TRINITY_DN10149_c0_g1_i1:42-557(+)
MKSILLICLAFVFLTYSIDVNVPIILQYTGTCTNTSTTASTCTFKASTQNISTHIDANAGAMTTVKPILGAHSYLNLSLTFKDDKTYLGNGSASFGLHDEHTITFDLVAGFCVPSCSQQTSTFLAQAKINGGTGAYTNASGLFSSYRYYSHEKNPEDQFIDFVNYVITVRG